MGISKAQLKEIVKECLVEILSEGINNVGGLVNERRNTLSPRVIEPQRSFHAQKNVRPSPLDERVGERRALNNAPNNLLKNSVKIAAGGNKMMESIFADAAMTTLQNQLGHGDTMDPGNSGTPMGGGSSLQQVEKIVGTPEEVFGAETAARWADLAFSDGPVKKSA